MDLYGGELSTPWLLAAIALIQILKPESAAAVSPPLFRPEYTVRRLHKKDSEAQNGKPERIRRVLHTHTRNFDELKNNAEKRQRVFAELDNQGIPVIQNRNTREPWAPKWSDLRPRTKPYNKVMTSLSRYYSEIKRGTKKQPVPSNSESIPCPKTNS
jgi:hypothetical protein